MGFENLTVTVPDGEIFATRRGSGPPTVFLHGGPGLGAEYMVSLVEELDGLVDGVLPQQRGLSPSTLDGPHDVETHVTDEIAVLDHLGWDRAWLIGHAWGGHLAMHIAVAHPERVAGLILIDTLGAVPDGGAKALANSLVARLDAEERANLDALLAHQANGDDDPALMAKIYMALWPSYSYKHGNVLPPVSLRLEVPSADGGPDTLASVRAHFEAGTLVRGLPAVMAPTLLIHGEGDPLPASVSEETARLIQGARVEIVEGAGHFPWIERPGVVRSLVAALLAS